MVADWVRGPHPRPVHWPAERPAPGHLPDDGRFYEAAGIGAPPLPIIRALREHCRINAQSYFLAVFNDEGETEYFSGPQNVPDQGVESIFNMKRFLQYQKRAAAVADPTRGDSGFPYDDLYHRDPPPEPRRLRFDHRPEMMDDDGPPSPYRTRKRPRANLGSRRAPDDDDPPVITKSKKPIKVGDSDELWEFYSMRFRNIQQNACKLIAKIWVKAVAPKKQTNNPYTAGDKKAPDWWPKPWGPGKDERVRHVEPDHLLKKERVHLLVHILKMIIEPNATQHADIQKLNIDVDKLEEITMESLSGFFNENDKNNNAKKKPYLKEIFKVARHEEQYRRGEIDAGTHVFVMADEKLPDNYQSDDEMDVARDDDPALVSARPPRISPPKSTGSHGIMSAASSDHSPATVQGTTFMGDIPVRGPQYPTTTILPPDLTPSQHSYVESGSMSVSTQPSLPSHGAMHMQDMIPSPHDSSRRGPMFSSAPEFSTASGPGLYSAAWQQGTTAPANSALYAFNPQPQPPPSQSPTTYVPQQGVTLNQGPQYLRSQFGLPQPTDVYQGGPSSHSPGYSGFLPPDGRTLAGTSHKMDSLHRGPLH